MNAIPPLPTVLPIAVPAVVADDNPHMLVSRYRKARKCAQALLAAGADAASAETLGTSLLGRNLAAQVARTHVCSETSWALVVELVREVRP